MILDHATHIIVWHDWLILSDRMWRHPLSPPKTESKQRKQQLEKAPNMRKRKNLQQLEAAPSKINYLNLKGVQTNNPEITTKNNKFEVEQSAEVEYYGK